ncbi:(Dimethylallyl)adenosine tRNA methylthiotransferase MiaB [Gossypium australe]|uniref:(Dimethylallyl)adenosine tRNA methylthiotransferase MiaB n=1 Tax=Gossypium australe TaxID=47621 RepID=A0A5B6VDB6_9ROSI|nr:(Dimethylallyl)adenosine tRNA methylthiotransferase MiaB [Gossypium australe]
MAREGRGAKWGGHGLGSGSGSGQCSYKRITVIVCSVNIVIALYVLHSLYSSLYIYSNKDHDVVMHTSDHIKQMEESVRIRRASEPIELVKLVKRLKHGFSSEESMAEAELPQAVKNKITDEILQRLRSLRPNASVSEQHVIVHTKLLCGNIGLIILFFDRKEIPQKDFINGEFSPKVRIG